jgi:protein tyrosine phosphatase (PTP) superfamily phosphohydrolase (DUF442 family)
VHFHRSHLTIYAVLGVIGAQAHSQAGDSSGFRGLNQPALPNAIVVTERVISGGQPAGSDGFAVLKELGVQTVVSVDGVRPEVEMARRFGLKYVHLPHGYDGIQEDRAHSLAAAIQQLPGRIYFHCHHGRHRSPAAAAIALIGTGHLSTAEARQLLAKAGTSPEYQGLWQSVDSASVISERLRNKPRAFPESVDPAPLVEVMGRMELTLVRLEVQADVAWQADLHDPGRTAVHEALLLKEYFNELLRLDGIRARPQKFRSRMETSRRQSHRLHQLLKSDEPPSCRERLERATSLLKSIREDCRSCHQQFRD